MLIRQSPGPHLGLKAVYEIYRCEDCRAAFVQNLPSARELAAIYDRSFFDSSQQAAPVGPRGECGEETRSSAIMQNCAARVRSLRKLKASGSLLDVGCGKGFFLKTASEHYQAMGLEPSRVAARFARDTLELDVCESDLRCCDLESGQYDVVTLWDVLAGLPDPQACVGRLAQLLKPGGLLVMTVPDIESLAFTLLGRFWPLLIPPINLYYYSRTSIEILLESNGLVLKDYAFEGKYVSTNFIVRKAARILGLSRLDSPHMRLPFAEKVRLNLRDIATVVAEKTCDDAA